MGAEAFLVAALASKFAGSMFEQKGIKDQAKAQQEELRRQEEEANRIAAEDASDRAIEADKQMALARVAMESIGGFGSQNDERLQAEIAGLKGLDLARIEGNRDRQARSLQSQAKSVRKRAAAGIRGSQMAFLGSALSTGAGVTSIFDERAHREKVLNEITKTTGSTS